MNPLLAVQTGECVEVSTSAQPESATWLVVRSPGKVLRPHRGGARIPGWLSPQYPDPKGFPPYLVCDARPAPAGRTATPGLPPRRDEPYVFPLNGFGMPIEAMGVLRDIGQAEVAWAGQKRRAYKVGIMRYGQVEGPWILTLANGVPGLGTMKREYFQEMVKVEQTFRVPETCR